MLERNYSFFHQCLLSSRKQYFGGAQAKMGGHGPPGPPVAKALKTPKNDTKNELPPTRIKPE